jgi:hypothetical protein
MTAAALLVLLVLYLPRRSLFALTHRTFESALAASLVEYLVLPSATWLVLLSMICLWVGARGLPAPEPEGSPGAARRTFDPEHTGYPREGA